MPAAVLLVAALALPVFSATDQIALGSVVEPRASRREVLPDPATASDWAIRRARYESARRLVLELTTTLTTEQKAAQ